MTASLNENPHIINSKSFIETWAKKPVDKTIKSGDLVRNVASLELLPSVAEQGVGVLADESGPVVAGSIVPLDPVIEGVVLVRFK